MDKTAPAFPTTTDNRIWEDGKGMSLRDYFAAKAMTGFNKGMFDYDWEDNILEGHAKTAYKIADAMMRQREL